MTRPAGSSPPTATRASIPTSTAATSTPRTCASSPNNWINAAMAGIDDGHNGGGPIWAIFDAGRGRAREVGSEAAERRHRRRLLLQRRHGRRAREEDRDEIPARADAAAKISKRPSGATTASSTLGRDFDFGKPRPLHTIAKPPFYAAWCTPVLHDTRAGLRINGTLPGRGHERRGDRQASIAAASPPAASACTVWRAAPRRASSPGRNAAAESKA